MRKRLMFGSGALLLAILVTLVVWQGSFTVGPFGPSSIQQTYLFWAVSTLIFILTVIFPINSTAFSILILFITVIFPIYSAAFSTLILFVSKF